MQHIPQTNEMSLRIRNLVMDVLRSESVLERSLLYQRIQHVHPDTSNYNIGSTLSWLRREGMLEMDDDLVSITADGRKSRYGSGNNDKPTFTKGYTKRESQPEVPQVHSGSINVALSVETVFPEVVSIDIVLVGGQTLSYPIGTQDLYLYIGKSLDVAPVNSFMVQGVQSVRIVSRNQTRNLDAAGATVIFKARG